MDKKQLKTLTHEHREITTIGGKPFADIGTDIYRNQVTKKSADVMNGFTFNNGSGTNTLYKAPKKLEGTWMWTARGYNSPEIPYDEATVDNGLFSELASLTDTYGDYLYGSTTRKTLDITGFSIMTSNGSQNHYYDIIRLYYDIDNSHQAEGMTSSTISGYLTSNRLYPYPDEVRIFFSTYSSLSGWGAYYYSDILDPSSAQNIADPAEYGEFTIYDTAWRPSYYNNSDLLYDALVNYFNKYGEIHLLAKKYPESIILRQNRPFNSSVLNIKGYLLNRTLPDGTPSFLKPGEWYGKDRMAITGQTKWLYKTLPGHIGSSYLPALAADDAGTDYYVFINNIIVDGVAYGYWTYDSKGHEFSNSRAILTRPIVIVDPTTTMTTVN